ncbi:MAG: TIGR02680 family protein, partial [Lachnospiraceae bacterium]|nr:TIGR02680 family protein [Lachnospiraceae bacterium]
MEDKEDTMTSEWQLSRIGLLDFWYYDDQEFEFLDGRMLLRGANGSGKSVTMQSFIPLLLDGNMRPESLDPFGSRARKMENYLLEEGDEREERTGYLYMELRRRQSDTFAAIGIGIRARKNKKLDTWYFSVTDGRRIGKDLLLYKDVQNRLTCTKQELRNRIGEGGRVMDSQSEYAACVNRLIFGFETMEEFQELMELLIQLRTPKLSKDFKPTVINEILSRSLQTLSEDDLRPMSEAIENMDNLRTNLDALNDSVHAAEQMEKAYDQYNEIVLYDKARLFTDAAKECRLLEKKANELLKKKEESERLFESELARYDKLTQEEEVLKKEQESLRDSDAARLKQQELSIDKELGEARAEADKKTKQEQDKEDKYRQTEKKSREQQAVNEQLWEETLSDLAQMEETLGDVPFDDFAFMKKELTDEPEQEYSFQSHTQLLAEYTKRVESGRELLLEGKSCQERYDGKLLELDECRSRQGAKERECRQLETLLDETKDEVIEKLYSWDNRNELLHLPKEIKQQMAQRIEQYQFGTDYSEIRELGKDAFFQKERQLQEMLYEKELRKKEITEEYERIVTELKLWRDKTDPEPERSEAVVRNRLLLQEKGIPYLEFYKAVDFDAQLDERHAANLEEALCHMGILDALIVPPEYKEQIEALDSGTCDKYIFGDLAHVKPNLLELLDVDNGENDILKYQSVSNILSGVGVKDDIRQQNTADTAMHTWVDGKGHYRIGILEGSITRNYTARFVGAKARERYRIEKITQLEEEALTLKQQINLCEEEISRVKEEQVTLQNEWTGFPSDSDLKAAAKEYADSSYALERLNGQIDVLREQLSGIKAELDQIELKVREICGKCYLPARLDIFVQALESLGTYRELLMEVQVNHGRYLGGIDFVRTMQQQMEEMDADLEDIRYERSKISRKVRTLEASLASVKEQLALTDYEEIRGRLDYCFSRLTQLPSEKEHCIQQRTHYNEEKQHVAEALLQHDTDYE